VSALDPEFVESDKFYVQNAEMLQHIQRQTSGHQFPLDTAAASPGAA
jgi:hypothetical protein